MKKQEIIDFVLQEGEGYKVEFKESFDKSLVREMTVSEIREFFSKEGKILFDERINKKFSL